MKRLVTLAAGMALLGALVPTRADAAPTQAELVGIYALTGSDGQGPYRGTLWVSDGGPGHLSLRAELTYDGGATRRWSALGDYAAGRITARYGPPVGLVGGVSGSAAGADVRVTLAPNADGTRLLGASVGAIAGPIRATRAVLAGRYVIRAPGWASFSEWVIELRGGQLVDSHTDDLPASDWPTRLERIGDALHLIQTTEASDALLIERVVLQIAGCAADGSLRLRPRFTASTLIDFTEQGDSLQVQRDGVTVEQPDGTRLQR